MTIREACNQIILYNKTQLHKNPVQIHNMEYLCNNTYTLEAEEILQKASESILNMTCKAVIENGVIVIN